MRHLQAFVNHPAYKYLALIAWIVATLGLLQAHPERIWLIWLIVAIFVLALAFAMLDWRRRKHRPEGE